MFWFEWLKSFRLSKFHQDIFFWVDYVAVSALLKKNFGSVFAYFGSVFGFFSVQFFFYFGFVLFLRFGFLTSTIRFGRKMNIPKEI